MALNNIELNPVQLVELYRNSLVIVEDPRGRKIHEPISDSTSVKSKKEPVTDDVADRSQDPWKYLGENRKNILLLVRYPNTSYLPDAQLTFLISILSACELGMADVAILNVTAAPDGNYKGVFNHFRCKSMVLFGLNPTQFGMPVSFPEFQVQGFNNCTFLCAPTLEELESDKVLKSKLWVSLRRMFGV